MSSCGSQRSFLPCKRRRQNSSSSSSSSNDSQPSRLLQQSVCWSTYWLNVTSTVSFTCSRSTCARPAWSAPVTAAMYDTLHWLSFPQRVTFKLCLLTYKCLHGLAPDYLSRFCTLLTPFLAVPCYVHLMQTNYWYHGPARPALDCVPLVLLVRLPGVTCRLICASWTYL